MDLLLGVSPERITETLRHVRDTHGDIATYLRAHGLRAEHVDVLRERLVDEGR